MNSIILNGNSSTEIQGLLIQSLPPISKPKIRTKVEEIDGRDGDIITKLGYSAYDKEFSIGLYGNFNINEVIAFFDSEGEVIFSNEPDKYYRYEIIEQIDFDRLLRFRTAKVKMHVQPFKYSATEIPMGSMFPTFNAETRTMLYGITITTMGNTIHVSGTCNSPLSVQGTIITAKEPMILLNGETYTYTVTSTGTIGGSASLSISEVNNSSINLLSPNTASLSITPNSDTEIQDFSLLLTKNKTYDMDIAVEVSGEVLEPELVVTNIGNTYAKPVLTVYGSGDIEIYKDVQQVLSISLGETLTFVEIDVEDMNAWQGNALANRLVTGDYNNLMLPVGTSTITWTGNVTNITLSRYSRWI